MRMIPCSNSGPLIVDRNFRNRFTEGKSLLIISFPIMFSANGMEKFNGKLGGKAPKGNENPEPESAYLAGKGDATRPGGHPSSF